MSDKRINAINADKPTSSTAERTCQYPEVTECPSCHYAIEPKELGAFYKYDDPDDYKTYQLYLLNMCKRCRQIFMSKFIGIERTPGYGVLFGEAVYSVPYSPKTNTIPDNIQVLSPTFAETYQQSEVAEAQQLLQICGIGYRKAVEFLVKDYLCHKHPEDTEKIRSSTLGSCLKRIDHPQIKVLAERSTWIGNDETHYVRKHENLDISNMKRFIRAILTYIESELAVEEALAIDPK